MITGREERKVPVVQESVDRASDAVSVAGRGPGVSGERPTLGLSLHGALRSPGP